MSRTTRAPSWWVASASSASYGTPSSAPATSGSPREHEDGRRLAESALAMAEQLGLDELRAHALTTVGMAKNGVGDPSGIEDMERALEIALEIDSPIAGVIVNNLAVEAFIGATLGGRRRSTRSRSAWGSAWATSKARASPRRNQIWLDFMRERWDVTLQASDEFIAACEAGAPHTNEPAMLGLRGSIRRARGDADRALADHLHGVELARVSDDPFDLIYAVAVCAATHADRGELDEARALVEEVIPMIRETGIARGVLELAPFAERLGIREALLEALDANPPRRSILWRDAAGLAVEGDFLGAAELVSPTGNVTVEAELRFQHLVALGRRADGEAELRRALDFCRSVGASYYVRRAEALLAKSA